MKTMRCLLCDKNFAFDTILYHLKHSHQVWEHVKTRRATPTAPPLTYEDKGLQVVDGTTAPPTTPEQQVPEEIERIVHELRNLEQATQNIQEQATQEQMPENPAEQLMDISSEDLVKFNDFDFNLLLL